MTAPVNTSITATQAFDYFLQQPKEELVQEILVQIDLIHGLQALQSNTTESELRSEIDALKDQLSYTNARISELEELYEAALAENRELREGIVPDWEQEEWD